MNLKIMDQCIETGGEHFEKLLQKIICWSSECLDIFGVTLVGGKVD